MTVKSTMNYLKTKPSNDTTLEQKEKKEKKDYFLKQGREHLAKLFNAA